MRLMSGGFGCSCGAKLCTNYKKKTPYLSFFRFPRDPERCRKWVVNCGRIDLYNRDVLHLHHNLKLCANHFEDNQFMNINRNRLVWNAVPTLFGPPKKNQTGVVSEMAMCISEKPSSEDLSQLDTDSSDPLALEEESRDESSRAINLESSTSTNCASSRLKVKTIVFQLTKDKSSTSQSTSVKRVVLPSQLLSMAQGTSSSSEDTNVKTVVLPSRTLRLPQGTSSISEDTNVKTLVLPSRTLLLPKGASSTSTMLKTVVLNSQTQRIAQGTSAVSSQTSSASKSTGVKTVELPSKTQCIAQGTSAVSSQASSASKSGTGVKTEALPSESSSASKSTGVLPSQTLNLEQDTSSTSESTRVKTVVLPSESSSASKSTGVNKGVLPSQTLNLEQDTSSTSESTRVKRVVLPSQTLQQSTSSAMEQSSASELLHLLAKKGKHKKRCLADDKVSSRNKQFKSDENQIEGVLQGLEDISDTVNNLDRIDDNFNNFGRYVVSLLRGLPTQKAMKLQQEFIDQILKSYLDSSS